jgi:hypothetical protein
MRREKEKKEERKMGKGMREDKQK